MRTWWCVRSYPSIGCIGKSVALGLCTLVVIVCARLLRRASTPHQNWKFRCLLETTSYGKSGSPEPKTVGCGNSTVLSANSWIWKTGNEILQLRKTLASRELEVDAETRYNSTFGNCYLRSICGTFIHPTEMSLVAFSCPSFHFNV